VSATLSSVYWSWHPSCLVLAATLPPPPTPPKPAASFFLPFFLPPPLDRACCPRFDPISVVSADLSPQMTRRTNATNVPLRSTGTQGAPCASSKRDGNEWAWVGFSRPPNFGRRRRPRPSARRRSQSRARKSHPGWCLRSRDDLLIAVDRSLRCGLRVVVKTTEK